VKENNMTEQSPILQIKNLKKYYPIRTGFFLKHTGDVKALDGVSFDVPAGSTLGLVGESGCGKSTLGKAIIRLHEPTSGDIIFEGKRFNELKGADLRRARQDVQMIFQDPFASLDPRMTVGTILEEPLNIHNIGTKEERRERVKFLIETVGLKVTHLNRYPHEFSGGQRQRISIARCLALNPKLIIADEPVSALDVSIQAQILNLLKDLQQRFNLTYLFISHNLSVVEHLCDKIAVMYLGKIVEFASRDELFNNPKHPYTQALIKAIPVPGKGKVRKGKILTGDVPSPINPPRGCHFNPRCEHATQRCREEYPLLKPSDVNSSHLVSCHLMDT
jgi:oligopeptide transport system ATP-binding protein